MKKPSLWQRKAMIQSMKQRKKVARVQAASAPANWDRMSETEREEWRRAEAEREDMSLDWNPLLGC